MTKKICGVRHKLKIFNLKQNDLKISHKNLKFKFFCKIIKNYMRNFIVSEHYNEVED